MARTDTTAPPARTVTTKNGRTLRVTKVRGGGRYDVRDQIGHFVAPASMREHPCPHRCCQNRRVHPANLPVKLDRKYLRGLSPDELERELGSYMRYYDERSEGALEVAAEIDRREESGRKAEARKARAAKRRQDAESEYRDEVYRQWLHAEAATNGYMLNKAGKAAGIDERTLFTGPESRVNKYASRELLDWFHAHPRPTRVSWFGNATARRAHHAGSRLA
jgi:hypothetical protein